jgi:1-deoxy-D-xylulose-5-phosphate synthase
LKQALEAAEVLAGDGISVEVVNARFAKPVDERIVDLAMAGKTVVTIEDHSVACGFGAAVLELAAAKAIEADRGGVAGKIVTLGAGDEFIKAASRAVQLDEINVSADRIAETVRQIKS